MPKSVTKNPPPVPAIDTRHTSFEISVRPSEIHRWGVYALEFIPKRHKVIEYTGERCNRRETSKRAGAKLNYMFTLDNYWAIDGSAGGSGAEYLNHSCEPNCYAWVFRGHILYMSARDIQPGEELTIDYHFAADVDKVQIGRAHV